MGTCSWRLFLCTSIWLCMSVQVAVSFYYDAVPCEFVTECPQLSCDESRQELRDGCCPVCVQHQGEICGGSADLQCAAGLTCRYRLGVLLKENATTGRCEPETCNLQRCSFRRYCIKRSHFKYPSCICGKYNCLRKYNPVCGYDGATYDSMCHLRREECWYRRFIGVRHFGHCVKRVTVPPTTPPTFTGPYADANDAELEEDDQMYHDLPSQSPLEGPLLFQNPEDDDTVSGCEYGSKRIRLRSMFREDSCTYIFCNENGIIEVVRVPGCQGGPPEKYYYEDKFAITGYWTPWTSWSECSGSCKNATRRRSRNCTNPAPQYEGRDCDGPSEQVELCLPEGCSFTCLLSNWTEWSSCSGTCGEGLSIRTRALLEDIPPTFREYCGDFRETQPCQVGEACECQRRQRSYGRLDAGNGCMTVFDHPTYFCGGSCQKRGKKERYCKAKIQELNLITHCAGEPFNRLMKYEHVANCRCRVIE